MEPNIYKPGAYKSPGIYNGAGGIYKGRGVYNDGENKDFLLLTYFNEYDINNYIDTPVIGKNFYLDRTAGVDVQKIAYPLYNNGLLLNNNNSSYGESFFNIKTKKIFSVEGFVKYNNGYFSFIIRQDPSDINDDFLGIGLFSINENSVYINKNYSYTTYNGTYYKGTGERTRFIIPVSLKKENFCSFVVDCENKKGYIYVDGILYLEISSQNNSFFDTLYIDYSLNPYSSIDTTQVCVRPTNYSINNYFNYPVPTGPYIPT